MTIALNAGFKVAIIGGGPTGIGIARELADGGIDFDLFEAADDFGGVWHGTAACGRTYPSLHLISPKFNTQVQDFPMPEEFPVYPNHRQMLDYIRNYARTFGIYEHTRFNTRIDRLVPEDDGWRLHWGKESARYPLVVVCNGLQNKPHYPEQPYAGQFSGKFCTRSITNHQINYAASVCWSLAGVIRAAIWPSMLCITLARSATAPAEATTISQNSSPARQRLNG